jgi:iron complex outermembrane receptor protein
MRPAGSTSATVLGLFILTHLAAAADDTGAATDTATLRTIKVSEAEESATGPVAGYHATRSATGTKTDTPLIETPFSVQVVSRELFDAQQVLKIEDAVKNVSGVYVAHGPDGNTMDRFVIRGFQTHSYGATYQDGLKDFSRAPKEVAGLERVEVLKGPAAIMYGRIEPGGMINRVSKRPQIESATDIEQQIGSYDFYRTTLDSTGALDRDSQWLYRANAAFEDSDGFKDFTHNRRVYIAPQLEWRPSEATRVRGAIEFLDDERSWAQTYGTIGNLDGPINDPIETNLNGKDDLYEDRSVSYALDWSHHLNDDWRLQQRITYLDRKSQANGTWLSEADAQGNYTREHWGWEDERVEVGSINLEVFGHFSTGIFEHTLLVGADYFDEDYDSGGWAFGGTPVTSNVRAPNYDTSYRTGYDVDVFKYLNEGQGIYAQDQIALGQRWRVLIGARYDDARYSYTYGTSTLTADDAALTWRGGVLYQVRPELSLYVSYVEGFGSSNFDYVTETAFDPETSEQMEAGVKWQPHPSFGMSVAIFQLVKDNLTMADPNDPLRTILAGEATSEGIEVDVSGQITSNWSVVAAYAYTDVSYTRSDTMQGERLFGVPRNGASFWTSYQFGSTGFEMGAGLVHRSSQLGTQRAWSPDIYPYTLEEYTLVDLMAGYSFDLGGRLAKVQLNVSNATDERYNPSSYGDMSRIVLGEPRMIMGSFRLGF